MNVSPRPAVIQSAFQAAKTGDKAARIDLYGDIFPAEWGGIDETIVNAALQKLGDVSDLDVHINSRGGDVCSGWAIRNLLAQHPAAKTVYIDGIAASSAATIAMTLGGLIVMPVNSMVMFHESQTFAFGSKTDIQRRLQEVTRIDAACITLFAQTTGKTEVDVAQWFSDGNETWLNAKEAKSAGFEIIEQGEVKLAAKQSAARSPLHFKHAPACAVALLNSLPTGDPIVTDPKLTDADKKSTESLAPVQTAVLPVTESAPAPAGAGDSPHVDAPTAPAQTITMTREEFVAVVDQAIERAVNATQSHKAADDRRSEIAALCLLAKCEDAVTQKLIASDLTVAEVRHTLSANLAAANPAPSQGGGGGASDPHANYRREYAADKAAHPAAYQSISEEQYVRTRCREDNVAPPEKKAA